MPHYHGLSPHRAETHRGAWHSECLAPAFRGNDAKTLREEFAVYGLPFPIFCLIGILKVGFALALLASLWIPSLAQPAALGMGALMLGAFFMHLKVKDPINKALPSLAVLVMCAAISLL